MASNTYKVGGKKYRRSVKQGKKTLGLGKPFVQRLFLDDETVLEKAKEKFGYLYNKNDFVRNAVKYYINNVYAELLKQ